MLKNKTKRAPIEVGIKKIEVEAIPTEKIHLTIDLDILAYGYDENFKKVPKLLDKINQITL